jgi:hypothetical protein
MLPVRAGPPLYEPGARPLQVHCHWGLSMLYAATGQPAQARAALSTMLNLYRAMEMTFWLLEAEGALAQVERL